MKKTAVILILAAIFVLAAPVSAQGREMVGDRLSIYYSGTQTFQAGEPFHIVHGWILDPADGPSGRFIFKLQVDGVFRDADFLDVSVDRSISPEFLRRRYVFNFPDGMSGEHTFTGLWLVPCSSVSEECAHPDQLIESRTSTVTVNFDPEP